MENRSLAASSDYRDYLYRLTYFLLRPLVPYVPSRIKPNQITAAAFLFAMLGTLLLLVVHTRAAYLYWVIFNFVWFLLDALDGMHARYTGQSSEYGAFLDHALDNIYFIFMLTAFAAKFDLTSILYIYIIILRVTAAVIVFVTQCHTKRLYLSRFSGGLEFFLLSLAMILSYCFPNTNPMTWTANPFLLNLFHFLHLENGVFMKLALCIYFISTPFAILIQFRFASQVLNEKGNQGSAQ